MENQITVIRNENAALTQRLRIEKELTQHLWDRIIKENKMKEETRILLQKVMACITRQLDHGMSTEELKEIRIRIINFKKKHNLIT